MCKHDTCEEAIWRYKDHILGIDLENQIVSKKHMNVIMEQKLHSHEYFMEIIDKLSWNSACGLDGITTILIKKLREPVAVFLANLHNTSIKMGVFPNC